MDARSHLAMPGGKTHVAAAQSQAVGLAAYRACNDLKAEPFELDHTADHGDLLKILFAEICPCGPGHSKQLAHHLRHAIEMSGTHFALHDLGHRAEIEHACILARIHLLDRGHKRHIDPGCLKKRAIGLLGTGIGTQVIGIIELRGIDKYTDNHQVVVITSTLHQR